MKITTNADEHFKSLNERIRACADTEICVEGCMGQRYIAAGSRGKKIEICGVPGNALGAYLDGSDVIVHGNVQDQTGDTMNGGSIVVYGSAGDATGYAMRGGKIFVRGDVGYRTGIHMKAYGETFPVIVAGGRAGSFLGEYLAGGVIVVLGGNTDGLPVVGNFCASGMHGGAIYLRCEKLPHVLNEQISAEKKRGTQLKEIHGILREYCGIFGLSFEETVDADFFVLTPDMANPYRQLYTGNR